MLVRRQCVQLLPQLTEHLPEFQHNDEQFRNAMLSIFKFMNKKEKDKKEAEVSKGSGFISLGKISLLASRNLFEPHLPQIFDLIEGEIQRPPNFSKEQYSRPISNTDVLICIKDLAKNYGDEIEERFSKSKDSRAQIPMNNKGGPVIPGLGSIHMYHFIANLFYFGFKRPLIDCLRELTHICNG